jgi:hypothetical protein
MKAFEYSLTDMQHFVQQAADRVHCELVRWRQDAGNPYHLLVPAQLRVLPPETAPVHLEVLLPPLRPCEQAEATADQSSPATALPIDQVQPVPQAEPQEGVTQRQKASRGQRRTSLPSTPKPRNQRETSRPHPKRVGKKQG